MRILSALLSLTLLLTLLPAHAADVETALHILASDDARLLVDLTSPAPTLRETVLDGAAYTDAQIAGLSAAVPPGAPALPAYAHLIALPPAATATLRILAEDSETIHLALPVAPVPTQMVDADPQQLVPSAAGLAYILDPAIYTANALYPATAAALGVVTD